MAATSSRRRTPAQILDALADVASAAAQLDPNPYKDPDGVSERAWSAARFSQLPKHGRLPVGHELSRQLSNWLGRTIGWPTALKLAFTGRPSQCDPPRWKEEGNK